jgi:hypothetical protein
MTAIISPGSEARHAGVVTMAALPLHPRHPERVCWGCDRYCPDTALACGNGTIRTPHPSELFGDDWLEWAQDRADRTAQDTPTDQGRR